MTAGLRHAQGIAGRPGGTMGRMPDSFEELTSPKTVTAPQVGGGAATALYDKAREAANTEPGHKPECEAHGNGFAYCSCGIWEAACTGVTTTLLALRGEDEPE